MRQVGLRNTASKLPVPTLIGEVEELPCAPALYDHDTLSRVVSYGFSRTLEQQVQALAATSFVTTPMEIYNLGPGCIISTFVETASATHWMGGASKRHIPWDRAEQFSELVIANSRQGLRYFGHWLRDDCAAYEALKDYGPIRSLVRHKWGDSPGYERLFEQEWQDINFAVADRIVLHRELGFNLEKKKRLNMLRQRVRQKISALNEGEVVYLTRGLTGDKRSPDNEEALIAVLSANGVRVVRPEKGIDNTVAQLLDARVIITVEGSQAGHAVFTLQQGGGLLILQPPNRFYNPHHEWTRLLGMKYGIVIGERSLSAEGFFVSPEETLKMVDRLI